MKKFDDKVLKILYYNNYSNLLDVKYIKNLVILLNQKIEKKITIYN